MFFGITFISFSFSSPFLLFYVCFLAISPISYIMKWLSYHRRLWKTVGTLIFYAFNLKCWHNNVDEPIIFSSYVTMTSHFNIFVKTFLITNMTFISFLKFFFALVISKGLLKFFFIGFFYIIQLQLAYLPWNCELHFLLYILNWFALFIIRADNCNLIPISTVFMILISFFFLHSIFQQHCLFPSFSL